ncbi:MAG TPA: ZPR1 zinc finger domain-containing protein [Methanocorpusculum sp.]|nr:ZPR1 zinc finger domain-containing protein [Methanocorpusculum sp.]
MRQEVTAPCPDCGKNMTFVYDTESIPYFSDILLIGGVCKCGFRIVDTLILNDREPCMWEMKVSLPEDLNARVIRSSSATFEIPELGIEVKPGPACSGFVSNVEGMLARAEDAVQCTLSSAE